MRANIFATPYPEELVDKTERQKRLSQALYGTEPITKIAPEAERSVYEQSNVSGSIPSQIKGIRQGLKEQLRGPGSIPSQIKAVKQGLKEQLHGPTKSRRH